MGSAPQYMYFPALPHITKDLHTNSVGMSLTTSLFILFGGIGPILWASMSDFYHIRRTLYLSSLIIFIVASVGCGLSGNIWVLVVLRCIQSVGTSGTVSDCWEVTQRGSAFSILFLGQFFGPLIGPIIGGGITTMLGWRATFWFCAAYGAFLFCFLFIFLPETYRVEQIWDAHHQTNIETKVSLSAESSSDESNQHTRVDSTRDLEAVDVDPNQADSISFFKEQPVQRLNPFKSITMLKHVFVLLIAIQTGICFGTMFTIETVIPDLYEAAYALQSWQTGLSFIGAGVGNLIGSFVSGRLSDYLLKRARRQRGGKSKAEDRLTLNAWPGGFILVPLGVLIFGWCIHAHLTIWASMIGFAIVCFGMSQVYASGSAYLVDALPGKGASVTAAANLLRMVMACILSLIAHPVVESIGPGYLATILASLNILGMFCFVFVKLNGQKMRQRLTFGEVY
ncbi:major facilitator superfamily domain-containing protein [Phycomyces nitens]|nr:major facilitator superfamily domain-containing protein [Phycomyces nitens]